MTLTLKQMLRLLPPVVAALVALAAAGAHAQPAASATPPTDKADALSDAARKGDAAAVKKLLDEGVDVNTKFRYGVTALSYAADRGHLEVVKLLLDRGADVNVTDTFYQATPLLWAVSPAMGRKPEHAEVVRLLLQHGAQKKEQMLMMAVSQPADAATVKAFLDAGGIAPATLSDALEAATNGKHQELAALLQQAGAKPHVERKLTEAELSRYVGNYQGTGNPAPAALAVTTAEGRVVATFGGRRFTLTARDLATFGVVEQPGATATFQLDQDKATSVTLRVMGNAISFTRIQEK